jgi:hypothetical protein
MRSGNPLDNYYNLDLAALNSACPTSTAFLPCAIRRPEYQAAISTPSLRKIVFTAYDSASAGPFGQSADFLNPSFLGDSTKRDAVFREYRDMVFALYQTQHDTGKTFIIASWEADNQAYCGEFFTYLTSADFRTSCGDIPSRQVAINGITQWFQIRKEGILAGRQMATAAGYGGMSVTDGIEFNEDTLAYSKIVNGTKLPTILSDVIPAVTPGYVLYSSYDSQFNGKMEQDLRQIRDWLARVSPASQFGVGEVGFPRMGIDGLDIVRTAETVKAIQRVGLPIVILWEAFDTNSGNQVHPYGLMHATGQERDIVRILRGEMRQQAQDISSSAIGSISPNDVGLTTSAGLSYRNVELYGSFGNGNFVASALCDGVEEQVGITFSSTGQINVRLRHEGVEQRYCTFRISRSDGQLSLSSQLVID